MTWRRSALQKLPSPCQNICQLDQHDMCIGCARTRGEIGEWSSATVERQAEILAQVAQRRSQTVDGFCVAEALRDSDSSVAAALRDADS